jgi:hypothetical protein
MWKNAAIRGGLQPWKLFLMPVSLVGLKGLLKQEKYLERYALNDA